jgi:hypothetical protein
VVLTHSHLKVESIRLNTLLKQLRYLLNFIFLGIKTWLKFGSTAIGIKTSEGVVLGVEKKLPSKLMEPSKSEKLVEVCTKDF